MTRKEGSERSAITGGELPEGVTVVVPVYNEEDGVADVLAGLQKIMTNSGIDHEILVVDDGSKDRTSEIVAALSERVGLLRHDENRGYGAALKTGIRKPDTL